MTKEVKNAFLKKIELQAEINRMQHSDDRRPLQDWTMIAATHMGHLFEAVMKNDQAEIEKEILQIAAPLLELYQELTTKNDNENVWK